MLSLSIVPYVVWEVKENRPVLFMTKHVKHPNAQLCNFELMVNLMH